MILKSMQLPHTADLDRKIKSVLSRYPSTVLAILFGSVVIDRARNDSDLDIAVASSTPLAAQTHIAIIEDLALALGRPVDLIDLDRTHSPLLQRILTKGHRMLCQNRTRYAELLLRMVYEEADVMPYYHRVLSDRRQTWIGT